MVEGLQIRTKRTLILFGVLVTAVACARSGTLASDELDCGSGWRVFFKYSGHCVYPVETTPDMCPKSVPHRYQLSNDVVCSDDPVLSRVAVVAIAVRGRAQQDAGADQLLPVDGGIALPPAMADPPQIIDGTEPDSADVEFGSPQPASAGFADTTSSPDE